MKSPLRLLPFVLIAFPLSAARALDIQLIDVTGMTPAQTAAFDQAAQLWESRFTDPITVVLNVGFGDLDPGVLGSTDAAFAFYDYTNALRAAMIADAESVPEQNAWGSLPLIGSPLPPLRVQDHAGVRTVTQLLITAANAKALGLSPMSPLNPQANGADGTVVFGNDFASSFDFDRSDGIGALQSDFVAVAAHEIGHALGFVSATDIADTPQNALIPIPPSVLDVWRFIDTGGTHIIGNPVTETRWLTHGPAEYYTSNLNNIPFSHGMFDTTPDPACQVPGGLCQASHWSDDVGSLMDPSLAKGVLQNPTFTDSHAFDYIGYDFEPKLKLSAAVLKVLIQWITTNPIDPPAPFPGYPDPTPPQDIVPPFEPDGAAVVAFDWPGGPRSATAFYRFNESGPYTGPHFTGLAADDVGDGQVVLFPDQPAPETSPDSFMDFYMESDGEGIFFKAMGAFSVNGTGFDPAIGAGAGGYRFDLLFFGDGDGVADDVDAFGTFYLEADASGQPDPMAENVFRTGTSDPNQMVVVDWTALPEPGCAWMLGAGGVLVSALARRRQRGRG